MRRIERRRLQFQLFVGALLTAVVVAADRGGYWNSLERLLYDQRAKRFQNYIKPPATEHALLHVDIDTGSLSVLGEWPWNRGVVASIVDALYQAGAEHVVLDVAFAEEKPGGQDEALARAVGYEGRTVAAVVLSPPEPPSALYDRLYQNFYRDLETSPQVAAATLAAEGLRYDPASELFRASFVRAREDAMAVRIAEKLDRGKKWEDLGPKEFFQLEEDEESPLGKLFKSKLKSVTGVRAVERFFPPVPAQIPAARRHMNDHPPIRILGERAGSCGFANYSPDPDGKVRAVPLWLESNGRLVPQLAFAAACKAWGVSLDQVQMTEKTITIPRPGGAGPVVIPVHTRPFTTGDPVPFCMEIPLAGTAAWETMYDRPDHNEVKAHLPAFSVLAAAEAEGKIKRNEVIADREIPRALSNLGDEESKETAEVYPTLQAGIRPRDELIEKVLKSAPVELAKLKTSTDGSDVARHDTLASAAGQLRRIFEANAKLKEQAKDERARLRKQAEGRIVFVGWMADGRTDYVTTSLHTSCPGVVVHGAIYHAIMTQSVPRVAPDGYTTAATIILGLLATVCVALLAPLPAFLAAAALVATYLGVNGPVWYDRNGLIVGAAGPVMAAVVVWAGLTLSRVLNEITQKKNITDRFSSYVDPKLVRFVLDHPEKNVFEGQEKELTVMFTDLQGFTTLSEKLGVQTVKILSRYLEAMVPVIRKHNGYVNKFLGDGIMCFFGAPEENPDHAADAVAAVLAMQAALAPFNARLEAEGLPTLAMRAGVSTGKVVVGDAGPSFGCDYTVLGDRVNLAARLESANKAVGTSTLVTDRTVELTAGRFLYRPVAALRVKGKEESVVVHEVLCAADRADDKQKRRAELTRAVVDAFRAGDFRGCRAALDRLDAACGASRLAEFYRSQCDECAAGPLPEGWAGQIVLHHK